MSFKFCHRALAEMQQGALLKYYPQVRKFYANGWGGYTHANVRRMMKLGFLQEVTVENYALSPDWNEAIEAKKIKMD
jgi:hypothetical protein